MESVANVNASPTHQPIIAPPLSLVSRLNRAIRLWMVKSIIFTTLPVLRFFTATEMRKIGPTYTKRYDVGAKLENRVFIPYNHKPGTKLPLYIDIHGGGFAIGDPQVDDSFCRTFSDNYGYCVVSLDYLKSPFHRFPIAVHDLAEVAQAVLADSDLPVDYSKVVGGGFSAGGNLILAISQLHDLHKTFKGIIAIYPVVDLTGKYKGEFRTSPDGKPDVLENMASWFNWAYIPEGQDRSDPLLSPIYAPRGSLPLKMMFVGAEYDFLCNEASIMAKKAAGAENDASIGESSSWDRDGIKWYIAKKLRHGYAQAPTSGAAEEYRKKATEATYEEMAMWLKNEVLA